MSRKSADTDQDQIQMGLVPSHQLTERDIHNYQLPQKVGEKWKDLARALDFSQAEINRIQKEQSSSIKECCIEVIVCWMRREGRNATVEKLADALIKVALKNVSDELMCVDTTQNDRYQKTINQMKTNCRHLEEEGSKMRHTIKEQEDELLMATQKYQDAEGENSEMRSKIEQLETRLYDSELECTSLRTKVSELERELAIQRQQKQDNEEQVQEGLGNSVDAVTELEDVSGATRNDLDTDQENRERRITIQLKTLDEKLKKELTSLLQVPEVKEDTLPTAVKLDLLIRLSETLQNMYSEIQAMVAQTCKCNEDLKREFYDLAYHGLRAEHNDLVLRVKDLESAQAEMSVEEKNDFQRLEQYQANRQRQIDRLEKFWRGLFSSRERRPETSSSYPTRGNNNSKKALSRNRYTDPGARRKQTKPHEGATSSGTPPTSDEEKSEVCFTTIKKLSSRLTMKRILRPKESKENMCLPVSYRTHGDS